MISSADFLLIYSPAAIASALLAIRWRGATWGRTFGLALLLVYAAGVVAMTFFPLPIQAPLLDSMRASGLTPEHNLVPGSTLTDTASVSGSVFVHQVGGNLALFAPLGVLLPLLWPRHRTLGGVLRVGLPVVLIIEVVQWSASSALAVRYKSFDVDDILLNTAGLLVGWLLFQITISGAPPASVRAELRQWVRGPLQKEQHEMSTA